MKITDLPRLTMSDRFLSRYYAALNWWHYHHYQQPLYAAGKKLMALNPEVMPDTVRVRTWTRLGLSAEFTVRMIDADENMVTRGLEPDKDMGYWEDGRRCWIYFSRNNEYYIIEPKGQVKK